MAGLLSLAGQTALVAGGSGGIGSATASLLARAGARVLSVDRPGLAAPPGVEGLACDLADAGAFEALFAAIRSRTDRLDLLVHAAGITRDAVLWKTSDEDWSNVLEVNLGSAFRLLRGATPLLRARGGAVVLISSINGERGKFGQSSYAASKAGMIGLARSAARELGRFGVRVNVVAPGLVRTAMTAALAQEHRDQAVAETVLGRAAEPEDVAHAVLFLCSDLARHVTGQVLRVDGGQLMA
ncbi:MAG: SDR family oxidoreductase [Planctomycetes bacterium]|nr:SDR family oxidoreductase [Planctomycetota bacterium]